MSTDNNAKNQNATPPPPPEIGPDGLRRESSVISYTEKIIEEEQLQLRKYIDENYSKIRDVEKELTNLNMEMKLTAGPKKAALEHMRKKIEISTEKIRLAKLKEEQAQKAWEEATKAVKDEEAIKQSLCEDLNRLVQESNNTQFERLGELKRRLEALNPSRSSNSISHDGSHVQNATAPVAVLAHSSVETSVGSPGNVANQGNVGIAAVVINGQNQQPHVDAEGRKKKNVVQGRGRVGAVPKGRGQPGWTGAGFDVDGRS
ncbi:RAB6-interacting golgin [Heracleum sosnowskyi]|uniref:RAB6-interacting golgin n=1 Tax=Heracleum sosnowskyi TaxID=360622 RepID=A0AAD8HHC6_9APIA|nr:RAB6-interacting golgin [Heracleum sosnowskyi]